MQVRVDDARVLAGLVVDGSGEPHHAGPLAALRVGDRRATVGADAEAVDDPQVRALDRLLQLARLEVDTGGRERVGELPVRVHAAGASGFDQ